MKIWTQLVLEVANKINNERKNPWGFICFQGFCLIDSHSHKGNYQRCIRIFPPGSADQFERQENDIAASRTLFKLIKCFFKLYEYISFLLEDYLSTYI